MQVAPSVFLHASYTDRAVFKAGVNLEHGKTFIPPQSARALVVDYVKSTLSEWDEKKVKSRLASYSVYLSFTARYDDGREAQEAFQHTAFKRVDKAVEHADRRSTEILEKLEEISKASKVLMEREAKMTGWVTARGMCTIESMFGQLTERMERDIEEYKALPRDDLKEITTSRETDQSGTDIFSVLVHGGAGAIPAIQMGIVKDIVRVSVSGEEELIYLAHKFDTQSDTCIFAMGQHPHTVEAISRHFLDPIFFPNG